MGVCGACSGKKNQQFNQNLQKNDNQIQIQQQQILENSEQQKIFNELQEKKIQNKSQEILKDVQIINEIKPESYNEIQEIIAEKNLNQQINNEQITNEIKPEENLEASIIIEQINAQEEAQSNDIFQQILTDQKKKAQEIYSNHIEKNNSYQEEQVMEEAKYDYKISKLHQMIGQRKRRQGKLDCVIVMDLTGSMDSYLNKMKKELAKLLIQLNESNKDIQLRFAFVGYKDFCDGKKISPQQPYETMTEHFSIIDFTDKMEDVNNFLQNQIAEGGGDTPEDVVGGLNQVFRLKWDLDAYKIVILVADAPTHGNQYHECSNDEFPNGHPNPKLILESTMEKFANIGASFLVFRLNYDTETMFEIMKKEYKAKQQKIRFVDLRKILQKEEFQRDISVESDRTIQRRKSLELQQKENDEDNQSLEAYSIVNLKIAEKIFVSSLCLSYNNESWDKNSQKI